MSRSTTTSTASRIATPGPRSMPGSPPARSRCSSAANGSPPTDAGRRATASTRRCRDHMPSSHRRYADWTIERNRPRGGRDRAVGQYSMHADPGATTSPRAGLPGLPRHFAAGAFGHDQALGCGPRRAPSRSARLPMARSNPSSTTSSISSRPIRRIPSTSQSRHRNIRGGRLLPLISTARRTPC